MVVDVPEFLTDLGNQLVCSIFMFDSFEPGDQSDDLGARLLDLKKVVRRCPGLRFTIQRHPLEPLDLYKLGG